MYTRQSKGPFCQSCGMPMVRPEDFGTESNGNYANDFCHFCYANGVFTEPGISFQVMLNRCTEMLADQGIVPEFHARVMMTEVLPNLKRWRVPVGEPL
jgi:hypothetical protein